MDIAPVVIDKTKALDLYRDYQKHLHYSKPVDEEVRRAAHWIGRGKLVISALDAIKAAGLNSSGYPKLAIGRADLKEVFFYGSTNGRARFASSLRALHQRPDRSCVDFPAGTFAFPKMIWEAMALLPAIPLHVKPQRGLANYHVLWEAEWTPIPPRDPYLLRRIGRSDMWLVVAQWDLTEIERAVLAARMVP